MFISDIIKFIDTGEIEVIYVYSQKEGSLDLNFPGRTALVTGGDANFPQIGVDPPPPQAKLKLRIPSLPEQTVIATILFDMDAELATLEQRRDKTLALKQAMMQELLTGRIRLV